jgi:hypothetical protein
MRVGNGTAYARKALSHALEPEPRMKGWMRAPLDRDPAVESFVYPAFS